MDQVRVEYQSLSHIQKYILLPPSRHRSKQGTQSIWEEHRLNLNAMGMYVPSKEGLLGVCILLLTSGALIIPTWPGEGGAYAVDGIINKPKDVPGQKVNAGDDGHRSIDELALVAALNVILNRPMKSREVIN